MRTFGSDAKPHNLSDSNNQFFSSSASQGKKTILMPDRNQETHGDRVDSTQKIDPGKDTVPKKDGPTAVVEADPPRPSTSSTLPGASSRRTPRRSLSEPKQKPRRVLPSTPVKDTESGAKGKRKADEVDGTPPDHKKEAQRATFAIPTDLHRAFKANVSVAIIHCYRTRVPCFWIVKRSFVVPSKTCQTLNIDTRHPIVRVEAWIIGRA
jgi:hypothetical protein